ncbi:unnamed protein product [Hymenolepis diminuta]|uniref:Leucine-rich repeat-containing protein 57 n=2 Tax=Hymenolepis diminuta TaxID=6216 RepID=A0A564YZ98_HYMDI|nr:unnamed protein product [Hymenolepis diminuta]
MSARECQENWFITIKRPEDEEDPRECGAVSQIERPWIGRLVNLKVLNVSGNKLEHLPGDLSHLSKLEILNASHNRMTTFLNSPNSINLSSLRHLRTVDLSNNQLTEFPLELCFSDIPLDILDLSKNKISLIPDAISPLQVIELNLCENEISVISESLSKCPRLKVLRLAHNKIQLGEFPLALLESSNISLLTIEGNPLSLKVLQELPAYAKYMERYTATKRKAMP